MWLRQGVFGWGLGYCSRVMSAYVISVCLHSSGQQILFIDPFVVVFSGQTADSSKHWSLTLSFPLLYVFWLKLSSSCQWFPHGPLNRHNPKFSTWNSLTDFVCVSQTYTNEQTCDRFMCAFVGSLYASESLIRLPVSPCRRLLSCFLLSATCLDVLGQCIV